MKAECTFFSRTHEAVPKVEHSHKHISVYLKGLKPYKVFFPIMKEIRNHQQKGESFFLVAEILQNWIVLLVKQLCNLI